MLVPLLLLSLLAPTALVAASDCSAVNDVINTWNGGGEAFLRADTGSEGPWKMSLTYDVDITAFEVRLIG